MNQPTPASIGLVTKAIDTAKMTGMSPTLSVAAHMDEDKGNVLQLIHTHMDALLEQDMEGEDPKQCVQHCFEVIAKAIVRHWGMHEEIEQE